MPPHTGGRVLVGYLDIKIHILSGLLVPVQQLPEDTGIVVEGRGTAPLPSGRLISFPGPPQNGDFRLCLFYTGLQVDSLHEIIAVPLNCDEALRQGCAHGIFCVH